MIRTDFYTGEMSTEQYTTEAEAVQNASFGQYAAQQQSYIPPTTYGLGGNVYQGNYGPPQQQYYQNPYMNIPQPQQYGGYYANPQPQVYGRFYGNQQPQQAWGNPVFQQGYQPIQPQPEPITQVFVPPVNMGTGDYLLPNNIQDIAQDMLMKYYNEEAEYQGKRIAEEARLKRLGYNNPYYYGNYSPNYYGGSMYGTMYNNFHSSVFNELEEIKKDAKQKRIDLSKQLSRLAHNCLNDGVTDEQIDEMYEGKFINVENTIYQWSEMDAFQARFTSDRFVPIDPGQTPYRQYVDDTRKKIESILPKDTTLEEFGPRMNILLSEWELQELKERRRGFSDSYNSSTYKRLLRDRIAEKEANKHGFSLFESDSKPEILEKIDNTIADLQATKNENLSAEERTVAARSLAKTFGLDMLSDSIYFDEDGNMCLTANFGSHKGDTYSLNENEGAYINKRAKFLGFEDTIPKSDRYPEEKIKQYNSFTESEFMFNTTHPPESGNPPESGGG